MVANELMDSETLVLSSYTAHNHAWHKAIQQLMTVVVHEVVRGADLVSWLVWWNQDQKVFFEALCLCPEALCCVLEQVTYMYMHFHGSSFHL